MKRQKGCLASENGAQCWHACSPVSRLKRLQPSVSDSSFPAMRQRIPEVRGGNSVGLPGCGDWTGRGEKHALQNPRRHLLEAEAFWTAPAAEGEPTTIIDKRTQFSSYLKLRKNKWGNREENFDLCCRRRTQNLRDPSLPLLPNICLYSTKWIVYQVIVFLYYIYIIKPFKHTRIYKI